MPRAGSTYDRAWAKLRPVVLYRDRYECQIKGPLCTHRATEVDHIQPHAERPDLRLELSNLRAACKPCNARAGGILGAERKQRTPSRDWFGR